MANKEKVEETEETIEFEPAGDNEVIEDGELTPEQAEQIAQELRIGEKIFEFDGTKYKIKMPSMQDTQEADLEYSSLLCLAYVYFLQSNHLWMKLENVYYSKCHLLRKLQSYCH